MSIVWVWSVIVWSGLNQPTQSDIGNVVGLKGMEGQEGTGVVISLQEGRALVLTANHILAEGDTTAAATLFPPGAATRPVAAIARTTVIHRSKEADIALLRMDATGLNVAPARLAPARTRIGPAEGGIRSVGCDRGYPTTRQELIVGKRLLNRPGAGNAFFWQARDPGIPGRSGGPLWNAEDQLIGICSGYQAGKGYYTHIDEIRALCRQFASPWQVP